MYQKGTKKTRFKKTKKGKVPFARYKASKSIIRRGAFGIKFLKNLRVSAKLLETLRRTLRQVAKKKTKIWLRSKAITPVTRKPKEVRMGKGKGSIDKWVAKVPAGVVVAEVLNGSLKKSRLCFLRAQAKMPTSIKLVERINLGK